MKCMFFVQQVFKTQSGGQFFWMVFYTNSMPGHFINYNCHCVNFYFSDSIIRAVLQDLLKNLINIDFKIIALSESGRKMLLN